MKFYLHFLFLLLCCNPFLISQEYGIDSDYLLPQENGLFSCIGEEIDCDYNYKANVHADKHVEHDKNATHSINGDKLDLSLSAECEPLVTVANCVNIVSGTFFQVDKDLSSSSIEPIELTRFYDSDNRNETFLGFGFGAQYPLWASEMIEGARHYYGLISERDGVLIPYQIKSDVTHSLQNPFKIDKRLMEKGYTNLNRSVIGGHANFVNWRAFFRSKTGSFNQSWTIQLGDGTKRIYDKGVKLDRASRSRMNFPTKYGYLLTKEIKPNGNQLLYSYKMSSDKPRLVKISSVNRTNSIVFDELNISYSDEGCAVINREGERAEYIFKHDLCLHLDGDLTLPLYCHVLTRVKSSKNGRISYDTLKKKNHRKVVRIEKPEGRLLEIHYEEAHSAKKQDKVSSISQPLGPNGALITTFKFEYEKNSTKVVDALGQCAHYRFDHNNRLINKNYFHHNQLIRQDTYEWSTNLGQEGWIKAKSIKRGPHISHMKTFHYDSCGNITRENIYGNLSGEKPDTFKSEEKKLTDQYSLEYSYSSDGSNLLIEKRTPEGWTTHYDYLPGTNLCTKVLQLYEGKIQERQFNLYDDNGQLKISIEDDGSRENEADLTGITYRRFTVIEAVSNLAAVYVGKPHQIRKFYRNQLTGEIVQLNRIEYHYDDHGNQTTKTVYEGESNFVSETQKTYDSHRRVIKSIDPVGRTTYFTYDKNGNKIKERTRDSGKAVHYTYDLLNRLVKKEEIHLNGENFLTTYAYDHLNQLISETDRHGHATTYTYDRLGRQTTRVKPIVSNAEGELIQPTLTQEYNILGQVIKKCDENGFITHYSYNVYGNPTKISYPDGAVERFLYYLNGRLKQKWDADGTSIYYTYDSRGQLTRKCWLDVGGSLLKEEEYGYKGSLPLYKKDSMGLVTHYEYDGAGRKSAELTNHTKIIRYTYDGLDRVIHIFRPLNSNQEEGQHELYTYDGLDRILTKTLQDSNDQLYAKESYEYDIFGNKTKTTVQQSEELSAHSLFHYNSDEKLAWKEDKLGNRTEWIYHHILNAFNQSVEVRGITDPMGRVTREADDVLGRLARRDLYLGDQQLSCTHFHYDAEGRLVKHQAAVMEEGQFLREYAIHFNYTSRGYLESETEMPGNKTTRYVYNEKGTLTEKKKPDGISLHYHYDPLGRIHSIKGSDGTLSYLFYYDLHDNPIEIHDLVNQKVQKRAYDLFDRLIQEEITPGLIVKYAYDALDRMIQMIVPDGSSVNYEYDTFHLKKISRFKATGELDYTCSCDAYDLTGNPLQENSPAGTTKKTYDLLGRTARIEAQNWKSYLEKFDPVGNLLEMKQVDADGEHKDHFAYDRFNFLISESSIQANAFSYDSLGNCLKKNGRSQTVNCLNQVTFDGTSEFTYDANGSLVSQTSPFTLYAYDAKERLIKCVKEGDDTELLYDSFGRCIEITTSIGKKQLIYQGDKEVGSMLNGKLHEFRLVNPLAHSETTFAIELQDEVYFPLQDYRHNICALQKRDGSCPQGVRYSAFGEESIHGDHSLLNPWRFANRRVVAGLSMFTHRLYHPQLRRWLTTDPQRFKDGLNLYAYVHNQPFFYTDPDGQMAWAIPIVITLFEVSFGATVTTVIFPALVATAAVSLVSYGCYQAAVYLDNKLNNNTLEEIDEKVTTNPQTETKKKPRYCGKELGDDPTKCPGEGFEWKGNGSPETGNGSWVKGNPRDGTGEKLHPDFDHPPPVKPHWDYNGPNCPPRGARLNLDGTWEWK